MRQFATQIFEARSKLEDFYNLEDSVREREEPAGNGEIKDVKGDVEFNDVSFGFANSSQGLHNVSFKVKAGQTVAIVGPTGAGKTTLVNLLQRVYDRRAARSSSTAMISARSRASRCAAISLPSSRTQAC